MSLADFRTLGRSGLVVSPFALGTMTFGKPGWGSNEAGSRAVFDAYVDAGGNFVDTADVYSGGSSEELVGRCISDRGLRDQIVLATKFGFSAEAGNPNAGGNGAKQIHRAIEGSLRRLRTAYIDIYWMHVHDTVTPIEEVLQTFGDLVRAGKIRYFGLSNLPAWYAARAATFAAAQGVPGPIALQLEYSLVARTLEREHVPAAYECGLGIVPWSPLAGGFLSGKYQRGTDPAGQGRLGGSNPFGSTKFTDRNWLALDALLKVAAEAGHSPVQVALAWVAAQPGVVAPLVGASRPEQLHENLAAADIRLAPEQLRDLDRASALPTEWPYMPRSPELSRGIFGVADVRGWPS